MHSKVDQELGAQLGNLDGALKRAHASSQPRARGYLSDSIAALAALKEVCI
jgi:hypothetical protein